MPLAGVRGLTKSYHGKTKLYSDGQTFYKDFPQEGTPEQAQPS